MSEGRRRDEVLANVERIHRDVERASERVGRDPGGIRIVAAAKTVEPEAIAWVRDAGIVDVGENYVRELRAKREAVSGIVWHFIGTLQSGSARHLAELADVVETAVPGRALERLGRRAAGSGRTIPVLVEVDFTGERAGVPPERVPDAADAVARAEGVDLVGLMTLPPIPTAAEDSRPYFRRLRELLGAVAERHPTASELSMGMSLDYEVAVQEGATMIRIGTALFGPRKPPDPGRM
ncbi:MAG TPA: YggS family pyridoxal phosphate-dependent enzyme [Actinomycetota bacterium]|nr:YggS family pyridoxal phosphate-dependent enzyme [Actinomycetota bacterium]